MLQALQSRRVERLPDLVRLQGRILFLTEEPALVRTQLHGQDLDGTPASKLRDNISTDEITPAYICYYYDETLGDFPYLGLKCGEEFPIARGSVKRGGFVASVSGQRRGKGSSREQSPYAEMCAGIRLVVARSEERRVGKEGRRRGWAYDEKKNDRSDVRRTQCERTEVNARKDDNHSH